MESSPVSLASGSREHQLFYPRGWVGGYKIETASKPNASDAIDIGNACHKQSQNASCRKQHAT